MRQVTEHHSEQEGESDYCEEPRVDFAVPRDSVGVNYLLEDGSELVEMKESGWFVVDGDLFGDNLGPRELRISLAQHGKLVLDHIFLIFRNPEVSVEHGGAWSEIFNLMSKLEESVFIQLIYLDLKRFRVESMYLSFSTTDLRKRMWLQLASALSWVI